MLEQERSQDLLWPHVSCNISAMLCCSLSSVMQYQCNAVLQLVQCHAISVQCCAAACPVSCNISAMLCCSLSSVPTASHNHLICLFVCLFIYLVSLVIYWACRSSMTSRCVVGVTGWLKDKGHMILRNISTAGHSATEHHFAARFIPYLRDLFHFKLKVWTD